MRGIAAADSKLPAAPETAMAPARKMDKLRCIVASAFDGRSVAGFCIG
jgi:hypothetical protein